MINELNDGSSDNLTTIVRTFNDRLVDKTKKNTDCSYDLWPFGFFRRRRRQQFEDINGIHNGSVIHANDANMYLHEASVTEKQPLAVATVTTNGYHHRQNRHSRQSLTYPHNMQPGDEVL